VGPVRPVGPVEPVFTASPGIPCGPVGPVGKFMTGPTKVITCPISIPTVGDSFCAE
jgi:hypothetical protein